MQFLKAVIRKVGFTTNELRAILFLSTAFLAGLVIRYVRTDPEPSPAEYDYSGLDSIFLERTKAMSAPEPGDSLARPAGDRGRLSAHPAPAVVDINTASRADLMRLPGIGASYADRILRYREEHGPFRSVNDLDKVRGIGKKTLEKLRPFIRIDADK
jgi:comEA protein